MKKKLLSILIVLSMVFTMFGCSSGNKPKDSNALSGGGAKPNETTDTGSVIDMNEKPYNILMPVVTFGDAPADLGKVQEEMNAYILPKINCTVTLEAVGVADLQNWYTMKSSGGEKLDLVFLLPVSTALMPDKANNLIMPLDELQDKWGKELKAKHSDLLEVGKIGGVQYEYPVLTKSNGYKTSFCYNAALVKKYKLEDKILAMDSVDDLAPILEIIKQNEPGVIPFTPGSIGNYPLGYWQGTNLDNLNDGYGVITLGKDLSTDYKLKNYYETDWYKEKVQMMYQWNQKGYVSKDALTEQEGVNALVTNGKAFCGIATWAPDNNDGWDLDNSKIVSTYLKDTKVLVGTNSVGAVGWAIATVCKRPDKVMQFLNLAYTDPTIPTLIQYGIKDVHYTIDKNGLIDRSNSANYNLPLGIGFAWELTPNRKEWGADFEDKLKAHTADTVYSPAFGFRFDSTSVATEISSCDSVKTEFQMAIEMGFVDPSVELPKFIEKLKAAGLDTIMSEKQKQLDAWVAQQGK